ncbi:HlyD family secretion protein [Desulfoluna butyratoxydans]|uniref:Rnd efflux pump membrane fusion protein barrel-sandwich domain n=1 Tax=Desulfoluna butyratoxydans TaxID=231438 RepID=A0A4V6ILE5_9BACT|nr:HlyD family secretion protein [Desulfoluna butyratoxydans]VFQ44798.1 rnd efflux pump membrane fusion protein barrel-sandwich domain [Desulfoluna butyratoxydans]
MKLQKNSVHRLLATGGLILVSGFLMLTAYRRYELRPWTRHGLVEADIVALAPQVNGKISEVKVTDNAKVRNGDVLFRIDARPYVLARDSAASALRKARQEVATLRATVDIATARVKSAEATYVNTKRNKERYEFLLKHNSISQKSLDDAVMAFDESSSALDASRAALKEAKMRLGATGEDNVLIESARLRLERAELDLSYTEVRSPVNGHVVNVRINPGDYAVTGQPVMAVVDDQSIHVMAAFKETQLESIRMGSPATVSLMTMPDTPLQGQVKSIGCAISPSEFSASAGLVPSLPAVFDWVRLAQRVPVEITFSSTIKDLRVIPGTTASVAISSGS